MDRRSFLVTSLAASGSSVIPLSPAIAGSGELRIGLTAVVVREYARFFRDFRRYLGLRTGRAVTFVQRRTYADIMDLLSRRELEAAWICGYPYIQKRDPEYLSLLVAPIYRGAPLYRSYVITPSDSAARSIDDLRGKVFAYSDPDSNSGYLVPRATVADAGYDPESFFRFTFFTYNHAETVAAVADRVADGGAVDSYVYDLVTKYETQLARRTRVLASSRTYGFPPIVVHNSLEPDVVERLRATLVGMSDDREGKELLGQLDLDGFKVVKPSLYDSIRDLATRLAARSGNREVVTK